MLDSGRLKQAFKQLSNALRRSLSPGVLVFLTGVAEDKGYLLAEALGDACGFINVGKYLSTPVLEVPRCRRSPTALPVAERRSIGGTMLLL